MSVNNNRNGNRNGTHNGEDPGKPFVLTASPDLPPSLVPIHRASDEHGHSYMFSFRDSEGMNSALEDLLVRYPVFKRKTTLMRSIQHWGIHLLNSGHEVGMNVDAFMDALDQKLQIVDSMQRAEESVKKAESRLSYLLDRREYLMCFEFMKAIDQMLETYSLPSGLYDYLWKTLREGVGMTRVVQELEERGFNLDHFKGAEVEAAMEREQRE